MFIEETRTSRNRSCSHRAVGGQDGPTQIVFALPCVFSQQAPDEEAKGRELGSVDSWYWAAPGGDKAPCRGSSRRHQGTEGSPSRGSTGNPFRLLDAWHEALLLVVGGDLQKQGVSEGCWTPALPRIHCVALGTCERDPKIASPKRVLSDATIMWAVPGAKGQK